MSFEYVHRVDIGFLEIQNIVNIGLQYESISIKQIILVALNYLKPWTYGTFTCKDISTKHWIEWFLFI